MSLESHLTERQYFVVSLSGILLLVLGLYLFILRPQFRERQDLRDRMQAKTRQLEEAGYFHGEAHLLRNKQRIEASNRALAREWTAVKNQLMSFSRDNTTDVANIDYKWYLYLTRDRLRKKARSQNINVPRPLGMSDTIESDDVARERMLQLLAVENLVDTSIEYGIADIRSIEPLPVVKHTAADGGEVYMEEFPLRVIFEGDMTRLYRLWEAMFQPGQAMMLRNIAMEKTSIRNPDDVRMTATLSSFLFLKDPEHLALMQKPPTERTEARGH